MELLGIIGGILAIFVSLGTLVGFYVEQLKSSEAKGRLLQRIDDIEKSVNDAHNKSREAADKISCHDGDLIKLTSNIENLHDLMERMDKKLDKALERK